ncbi:MAG: hypothetical protein ACOC1U_01085 [Spirochaetota bacterium]
MSRTFLITVIGVIGLTSILAAQQAEADAPAVSWRLLNLAGGIAEAESAVNAHLELGFVPVGIEFGADGSLVVLLGRDLPDTVTGWGISEHSDWNALESDINERIRGGYRPADISKHGNALYVLWLQSTAELAGWRIHAAAEDRDSRSETIQGFEESGFVLRGMSSFEGLDWFLFVRPTTGEAATQIRTFGFDPIALRDGINDEVARGSSPRGIGIDTRGYVVVLGD